MLEREGSSRRGRAGNGLRSEGGCVALGLEIAFRPRRRLVAQEIERELVPRRKVVVRDGSLDFGLTASQSKHGSP